MQLVNLRDFAVSDHFKLITWILFFNVIFILHITVTCRQTEHDDWAHQQNADLVKLIHVGKYCTMQSRGPGSWVFIPEAPPRYYCIPPPDSVHSPLYHTDTKPGHSLRLHLVEMTATVGSKPERTVSSVQSFRSDPALFPNVLLQMKKHGCESRFLSDSFLADPDSHDT